jgi:hypothetical protein
LVEVIKKYRLVTLNDVFDRILCNPRYGVTGKICLWNGGEPLLHPKLPAMLETIAKRKDENHQFAIIVNKGICRLRIRTWFYWILLPFGQRKALRIGDKLLCTSCVSRQIIFT